MQAKELVSGTYVFEELEARWLLAGEPWGFFPKMLGQDLAVQNYPQLNGQGLTVAVIDSGVDYNHPDLGGGFGAGHKIFTGWDFVDNDPDPVVVDENVHATGVVGVLAGDPYVYNGKRYQGIAPNVGVIVLREDTSQHVKDALQWVISHRVQYNIVAVNITDFYEPTVFNPSLYLSQTAQLKAAGVFIATPGGNEGAAVPVAVSSPAADPSIFGTTGIDHTGAIVDYFQRDASIDALGPGNGITLPYFDWATQTSIYTDYGEGSSWSAPHVTGTAILLKQINPSFTPDQIMSIIRDSGVPTFDPVSGLTFPRLNIYSAINLAYARLNGTAKSMPFGGTAPSTYGATIEAENFDNGGEGIAYHDLDAANLGAAYRPEAVDVEVTGDTGGGDNVGWAKASEWLKYTVNIPATAVYGIDVRVASNGAGGTFHIEADGINVTGTMAIPDTAGWQTWQTISASNVNLPGGIHTLRILFDTAGSNGFAGNVNWFRVTGGPPPSHPPYPGPNPPAVPGQVEMENFDQGGEGIAYHDRNATNLGGQYRASDGIDIERSSEGGYDLGWNQPGEWLEYTVNVATAGSYDLSIRAAYGGANAGGGTVHLESDGVDVTGPISLPKTGGWQAWQTVAKAGINLTAGQHVLKLVMEKDGAGSTASDAYLANLNWFKLTLPGAPPPPPPTQSPYPGPNPAALPGQIEAENFDKGGAAVAYKDLTAANQGGQYRPADSVDVEKSSEGGYDVGWNQPGEWLEYTVNVATAGSYDLSIRAAYGGANASGGTVHLESDGIAVTGPITLAKTGGWQTWQTVTTTGITLSAGQHVLRLVFDQDGAGSTANTAYLANLNWMKLTPAGTPGPVLPAPWVSGDVGAVGQSGSASFNSGVYTVQASGADIWGYSDAFRFVYQSLSGDGQIVARVDSLDNTDPWAKAGLMFRDGLSANARNVYMAVSPTSGTAFQYRKTAGSYSTGVAGPMLAAPAWLKLVRQGNVFSGYASADGSTWTLAGSQTIALGATLWVGLAVTSHNNAALASVGFSDVAIGAVT